MMLMCRNRYNFQKLTSIKDADISVYEEAIDFVFKNDDIKNVAITGSYSSEKSSVLETYKYKHSDKRFIHLSFTHFRASDQEINIIKQIDNFIKQMLSFLKI